MGLEINIIGAGRLGQSLGWLVNNHKIGNIQAVCNASIESALQAIDF